MPKPTSPEGYKPSAFDSRTKIKLVTDALVNAQTDSFAGMLILERTEENKLNQLERREIIWALETIQKANRDLFQILPADLTAYMKKGAGDSILAERLEVHFGPKWRGLLEDGAIALALQGGFDNWCEAQRHKKSISIANLSLENREKVFATVTAIYGRFELSSNPKVVINWVFPSATEDLEARRLSLEFLQNKDVVKRHQFNYTGGGSVEVEIDVKEFFGFRDELLALYAPTTGDQGTRVYSPTPAVSSNPFASMEDLRWQDITIRFLDGHTVKISAKETSLTVDFRQMGFEDARNRLPNTQWSLLKILAQKERQIDWEDSEASDNIKKKKQLLSETLKAFFRIDDDPFYRYRDEKAYRTKFTLRAEGD